MESLQNYRYRSIAIYYIKLKISNYFALGFVKRFIFFFLISKKTLLMKAVHVYTTEQLIVMIWL